MKFPVQHVVTSPISPLVGGKKNVGALIVDHHRICSGTMPSPFRKIRDGCVAIVQVDGIAVRLLLGMNSKGKEKKREDKKKTHG